MKDLFNFFLEFLPKNWLKIRGLLITEILIFFIYLETIRKSCIDISQKNIITSKLVFERISLFFILLLCLVLLIWLLCFFISRSLKKVKNSQIGIIIDIITDNSEVENKVRRDFIDCLKNKLNTKIIIINLPEHMRIKLHNEADNQKRLVLIKDLLKKSNSMLMIYGKVQLRNSEGNACYYIKLGVAYLHKLLTSNEEHYLKRELLSIVPKDERFPIMNEFEGFEFTSELYTIISSYLLGLSFYLSKKINKAFEFHLDVLRNSLMLDKNKKDFIIYKKILLLTKFYFIKENLNLVREHLNLSEYEKAEKDLKFIEEYLNDNPYLKYEYLLAKSVYLFRRENISEAIELSTEAGKQVLAKIDSTWLYNLAFLEAYSGNLDRAYVLYKKGFKKRCYKTVPNDVENFIYDVLQKEPDKIQLNYCLGLIYMNIKEDYKLAKEAFTNFIEQSSSNQKFTDYIHFAQKYSSECSAKVEL